MAKKPKFLKNLLTTASAVAVIASAGNAMGAAAAEFVRTNANGATLVVGGGANLVNSTGAGAVFTNKDNVRINADHSLATGGNGLIVRTLDINGQGGGANVVFTIGHALSVGSVSDVAKIGAGGNFTAANNTTFKFAAGVAMTLTGDAGTSLNAAIGANDYRGIRAIDFQNKNAQVIIDGETQGSDKTPVVLDANFSSTGADNGKIVINNSFVQLNGTFAAAGTAVKNIEINASKALIVNNAVTLNEDVQIGNKGRFIVEANKNLTIRDIKGAAANNGSVEFKGKSTVTSKIGNGFAVGTVQLSNGTIDLTGGVLKAQSTVLTHANSVLKLNNAGGTAAETNITTTNAGAGTVELAAGATTLKGSIGAADADLKEVKLADQALNFEIAQGGLFATNTTTATDNNGSIKVKSDNFTIDSIVGSDGKRLASVAIESNAAAGAAGTVVLAEGAELWVQTGGGGVDLSKAAFDNVLQLGENSKINGRFNATTANRGDIQVKGNSTIVGTFNNAIRQVVFDTAGKTLTFTGNDLKAATGVKFDVDGTLLVSRTDAKDSTITAPIVVAQNGTGVGTIRANHTDQKLILAGAIGEVTQTDQLLGSLELQAGDIQLNENAAIQDLNFVDTDKTLLLNNAGKTVRIVGTTNEIDRGNVQVEGAIAVTLDKNSQLGSDAAKLNTLFFNGAGTLNVGDGSQLHFKGIQGKAPGDGTLNFVESAVVNSNIGYNGENAGNKIGAITLTTSNDPRTVEFQGKIAVNGNISIGANRTADFRADVSAAAIDGTGANDKGAARFTTSENNDLTISSPIGAGQALGSLEFDGTGNIILDKDAKAAQVDFLGSTPRTVTYNIASATGVQASNFVTKSALKNHNLILNQKNDVQLDGSFGSADHEFGFVQITANGNNPQTLTINNVDFYASATTDNSINKLVLNKAGGRIRDVGTSDIPFAETTFNQNTTVHGNAWSKDINVTNLTTIFKGRASGSGMMTISNGAISQFDSGSQLDINVAGAAVGTGTIRFDGNHTINNEIGGGSSLALAQFVGTGANVTVNKNITATNISFTSQNLTAPVTLNGVTSFAGTKVNLGSSKTTLVGAGNKFTAVPTIGITHTNGTAGFFEVNGAGSSVDFSSVNAGTKIVITDNDTLPTVATQNFSLVTFENGADINNSQKFTAAIADANGFVDDSSADGFVKWTFNRDNFTLTRTSTAVQRVTNTPGIAGDADAVKAAEIIFTPDGPLKVLANEFRDLSDAKRAEGVNRLAKPVNLPRVADNTVHGVLQNVAHRRTQNIATVVASAESGVSAGDTHHMHGVWAMPFYRHSDQDKKSGTAGYEANSFGVTVGADTMVNADMTLGAAFSYAHTDVKHKDFKSGDKTDGDTFMFSVYGTQQFTSEWFAQGAASFGSTRFKNKENRITTTGNQLASGKSDSTHYEVELLGGYTVKVDDITILPMAGAAYTRINNNGYTETGTSIQNLTVKQKATNKLEVIAGAKVDFGQHDMQNMMVTPEVHGFVRHDLLDKEAKIDVKLGSAQSFNQRKAEVNRTFFDLGAGVMAKSGDYEFGIGYDATLASKFVGHQGTLKVRLNF